MADTALPIQGTWTPPTPPTPGGAAASAPTVGDAPAVVTATGAPSAGAASAVTGAWVAPTPPTPGGAAASAPSVGDAPAVVQSTGAPGAGAASAVQGAWVAPTPPTPGGAAAGAPTVGDAPGEVLPEWTAPVGAATTYATGSFAMATAAAPVLVIGEVTVTSLATYQATYIGHKQLADRINYDDGARAIVFAYPQDNPPRVELRALVQGEAGNSIAISTATSGVSASGATLEGGVGESGAAGYATAEFTVATATAADLSLTIGETTLTYLGGYGSSLSNRRAAAANIATAINLNFSGTLYATGSATLATVTIFALEPGTAGNLAMSTNYPAAFTGFPAGLTGGSAAEDPELPAPLPILP